MVLPPMMAEVQDEGYEVKGEKLIYGGNRLCEQGKEKVEFQ